MKKQTKEHSMHRAKNFRGTSKKLFVSMGRYRALFVVAIVFAVLAATLSVVGPRILNSLISLLLGASYQTSQVVKYGLLIGGIYIASALLNYFQGYCMSKAAVRLARKMRSDIIKKINTLPLNYFDKHSYGDILSRVTNDVAMLSNTLQNTLSSLITSSVTIVAIPVMMFTAQLATHIGGLAANSYCNHHHLCGGQKQSKIFCKSTKISRRRQWLC